MLNLLFLFPGHPAGFLLSDSTRTTSKNVTQLIINNNYDEACTLLGSAGKSDSTEPLFSVLKLATVGMRDVDFEQIVDSSYFLTVFNETEKKIAAYSAVNGTTPYCQMLSGMSKIIHATFYLRQKKYFSALQHGFDAVEMMENAQKSDTSNADVDFFLGLYEYARSELRAKLWWVLFWYPGDRQAGIKRVERCAQYAIFTSDAAKIALCDMYIQSQRMGDAERIITLLKEKHPNSRFVLWSEVKYFEAIKDYRMAAQVYDRLARSYATDTRGTYNSLVTRLHQAEMLKKAGDYKNAHNVAATLLKHPALQKNAVLKKETIKLMEQCNG